MDKPVNTARFEISGIDCPNCALDIEKALQKKDGLENTKLDFTGGIIRFNPDFESTVRSVLGKIEPKAELRSPAEQRTGDRLTGKTRNLLSEIPLRLVISLLFFAAGVILRIKTDGLIFLEWAIFLVSYTLAGYPVLLGAARNILRGKVIDELFLMTIATIGAFVIGELPEAAAVMLFYAVGETLQERAVSKSRSAIRSAMALKVDLARLVGTEGVVEVSPESVEVGSIIEILPGESVPLDGVVIDGESWMDTSALTGESTPRRISSGAEVSAGFINDDGRIHLRVIRDYGDSAISKVRKLLDEASSRKSRTEMILSRFASIYTPVVVGMAVLLALILPLFFQWTFKDSIYSAMILLVISCPCALVVSVPLAYFAGIGRASRENILLRGSDVLDNISRLGTLVFDKTGTLSEGLFKVRSIHPSGSWSESALIETAAEALSLSNHPIARSVREAWNGEPEADVFDSYKELKGLGVVAGSANRRILAGSSELLRQEGIDSLPPAGSGTVVHLAVDGLYAGYILLSDSLKSESGAAVSDLRRQGITNMVILTGDNQERGDEVGRTLGIKDVRGGLLPGDKLTALESIIDESPATEAVAFVGDGINDAPVILRADVGMAMGASGTDLAIEAADVVFMDDNPIRIPRLLKLAVFTRSIVIGNIVFALVVKTGFMILGIFAGLPMWIAVIGDVGVTLLAVLNSLRILYGRGSRKKKS